MSSKKKFSFVGPAVRYVPHLVAGAREPVRTKATFANYFGRGTYNGFRFEEVWKPLVRESDGTEFMMGEVTIDSLGEEAGEVVLRLKVKMVKVGGRAPCR